MRKRFIEYVSHIKESDIEFYSESFDNLPFDITEDDFVYVDPPYMGSKAFYNKRDGWKDSDEKKLLSFLDGLTEKGVRWMLSNNLGYGNVRLMEWIGKYRVVHFGGMYGNCNTNKKANNMDDEIIVMNY